VPAGVPVHRTSDPNDEATRRFLESIAPDVTLARCKTLLRKEIFDVPRCGTVVLHPGVCPEYRNAHGCFWALARRDLGRVGATLLRIDEGVDTGPTYRYYHADIDELRESHTVIQHRVVFDNLDEIADDLQALADGRLERIDTSGRESAAWGQPRLTDHLRWKRAARRAAA
jgi:methionyl-tRNA formyltransferase